MMLNIKSKQDVYKGVIVYSLIFILIRLFASQYGMTYDEAEQFLDARTFVLGYADQPPLYSWILKCFSFIFGLNVKMMILVYHLVAFFFLIYLYKISELLFDFSNKAIMCFLSFSLFFIYSYDFYRYTIHTALMMLMCAWGFYTFMKIYKEEASWKNYLLLGLSFGLGLLSKYNFIFFILALVISCLFTKSSRKVLLNLKTVISIIVCLLVFSPHLIWVLNNDLAPIHYAMERGEAGNLSQDFNLLGVILNTYWNYLVYLAVIVVFFFADLKKGDSDLHKFFLALLGFCVIFPLSLIVFLKAGNFSQRWLAPLNIFIPFISFSFIELKNKRWQYKLFTFGIFVLFIVFYVMRIASYYYPDQIKPSFLSKPYKIIYSDIKKDFFKNAIDLKDPDLEIYSFKELNIMAGMRSFNDDVEVKVIYPQNQKPSFSNDLIIFSKDNKTAFEKYIQENNLSYELVFSKSAPYLHSKKGLMYKLNFAIIDSLE